jgi:hypothetical protein
MIKSNSTGVFTAADPRITIDPAGKLNIDTTSPIPFVTLYVVAYTQGIATAVQEISVEVCGLEQVVLTMPSTNSSLEFTFE